MNEEELMRANHYGYVHAKKIKEILDKLNNKAEHYILYNYEVKLLLDYITNLQEKNKKYEEFVNELRKIVYGELVPRYHTNSERAKCHFNEGWSLFKSFVEDRMAKFIGEDKDVKNNR